MLTPQTQHISFRNLLILATVVTWIIGSLDIQHRSEQVIGFVDDFPGDPALWIQQGDKDATHINASGVTLFSQENQWSSVFRAYPLPPPEERLENTVRVRGMIDTITAPDSLPKGDEAAYMIWFLDKDERSFDWITVQSLTGHKKQYRGEKIVRIPEKAHSFAFALVSRKSNGHFLLTKATASLVTTTKLYSLIKPAVFTVWGVLVLWVGVWLFRQRDYVLSLSLTALLGATLLGVVLPESITIDVIEPAYEKLLGLASIDQNDSLAKLYKVGHFVFFFLIALLIFLRGRAININHFTSLQFLLIFVVITEGLQLYLFNRTTQLFDMAIDFAGVLVAWVLVRLLRATEYRIP